MRNLFAISTSILINFSLMAKAPIVENIASKLRKPAAQQKIGVQELSHYQDMTCKQMMERSEEDLFLGFFKEESKKISADLCSLVGVQSFDSIYSQADHSRIGLGTFSKLVEAHYDEFLFVEGLNYYQNLSCLSFMDNDADDFMSSFSQYLKTLNDDFCSLVKPDTAMDDDKAQASRTNIGLGTFSKMIETHYHDFFRGY